MTIKEFENRAIFNGGYDRVLDDWKILDVHMVPELLSIGQECDFYCSDGTDVFILRIRRQKEKHSQHLAQFRDQFNNITWLIAEIHTTLIDDSLILNLLTRFKTLNETKL